MTYRPPPIHVLAVTEKVAFDYVTNDLGEHPQRLHYISRPDVLRGKKNWLIHIHPTATYLRNYPEFMCLIRMLGFTTLTFNEEHARKLHEQQAYEQERGTPHDYLHSW